MGTRFARCQQRNVLLVLSDIPTTQLCTAYATFNPIEPNRGRSYVFRLHGKNSRWFHGIHSRITEEKTDTFFL